MLILYGSNEYVLYNVNVVLSTYCHFDSKSCVNGKMIRNIWWYHLAVNLSMHNDHRCGLKLIHDSWCGFIVWICNTDS